MALSWFLASFSCVLSDEREMSTAAADAAETTVLGVRGEIVASIVVVLLWRNARRLGAEVLVVRWISFSLPLHDADFMIS